MNRDEMIDALLHSGWEVVFGRDLTDALPEAWIEARREGVTHRRLLGSAWVESWSGAAVLGALRELCAQVKVDLTGPALAVARRARS